MSNTLVSNRYARSLYRIAGDSSEKAELYQSVLMEIKELFGDEKIRKILLSPAIPKGLKVEVLSHVVGKVGGDKHIGEFVRTLVLSGRVGVFEVLADSFGKLIDDSQGVVKACVSTVVELSEEELGLVKSSLEAATGKKINLSSKLDSSLLGGVLVEIGNKVVDFSLRNRLERMAKMAVV